MSKRTPPPPPELDSSWQKTPGWQGHYARMGRWRHRWRAASDPVEREDFLYAFFCAAANLADWLKAEAAVPQTELDALLKNSSDLRVARDISNVIKHRDLSDPKVGREYSMARQNDDPPHGTFAPDSRLTIYTNGAWIDAFEIANRCAREWDAFLQHHGVL